MLAYSNNLPNASRQQGAALITSLVLLVVLTLIGITSMTSSIMEEKMTGNLRNKHMAFQAAESALRDGELDISNNDSAGSDLGANEESNPNDANLFDNESGYADRVADPTNDIDISDWTTGTSIAGINDDPVYIIEVFGEVPQDEDQSLDASASIDSWLIVFRVTAQATGLNDRAVAIVQSTYNVLSN